MDAGPCRAGTAPIQGIRSSPPPRDACPGVILQSSSPPRHPLQAMASAPASLLAALQPPPFLLSATSSCGRAPRSPPAAERHARSLAQCLNTWACVYPAPAASLVGTEKTTAGESEGLGPRPALGPPGPATSSSAASPAQERLWDWEEKAGEKLGILGPGCEELCFPRGGQALAAPPCCQVACWEPSLLPWPSSAAPLGAPQPQQSLQQRLRTSPWKPSPAATESSMSRTGPSAPKKGGHQQPPSPLALAFGSRTEVLSRP